MLHLHMDDCDAVTARGLKADATLEMAPGEQPGTLIVLSKQ